MNHWKITLCAIDSTGLGMQMAEELKKEFGQRIEPVTFTNQIKEKMVVDLKRAMEEKTINLIPDSDLREDIHSIKRITTPSGNVRYDGSSSESHADRFWALALAYHANTIRIHSTIEWFTTGSKRLFQSTAKIFRRSVNGY